MTLNLLNNDKSHLRAATDTPLLFEGGSTEALRPQFWSRYTLAELNPSEWEALCDGCGSCCLIKYIDEDEQGNVDEDLVEYTDVTCQLMDCATGYCTHYATRQEHVPDCIQLTIENLPNMMWLRRTVPINAYIKGKACQIGIYY